MRWIARLFLMAACMAAGLLLPLAASASVSLGVPNMNAMASGLVGYWPMDGDATNWTNSTTNDLSGNGNTGTLTNMPTSTSPVAGKIGGALKFVGLQNTATNSYINLDSSIGNFNTLTTGSIAFWFKVSSDIHEGTIISTTHGTSDYDNFSIQVCNPTIDFCDHGISHGTMGLYLKQSNTEIFGASIPITYNVWHHFVYTANGAGNSIYLDGVRQSPTYTNGNASSDYFFANPTSPTSMRIGERFIQDDPLFDAPYVGNLDDMRIYSRVLSPTEIALLYAAGNAGIGHPNTVALSSGLVGHWTFDGGVTNWRSDTTQDSSGNGHTGTLVSMSTTTSPKAGKIGQALKFDGSTSYVTGGDINAIDGLSAITVAAWIKASSNGANGASFPAIVSKADCSSSPTDGPFNFYVESGAPSKLTMVLHDGSGNGQGPLSGTSNIDDGAWHFVVGKYDGNVMSIWVDGHQENSTTLGAFTLASTANPFNIGSCNSGGHFYNGTIDDVRIYNRALSAQEVQQLYTSGGATLGHSNTTNGSGLVGYWTFDGNKTNWRTNTEQDSSGNGSTASLVTFSTTTSPIPGKNGGALRFNGSTQYVDTGVTNLNYSAGTVAWWMKPTTAYNTGVTRPFWGQLTGGTGAPEFSCQIHIDNNFYCGWNNSPDRRVTFAANATNYPTNTWSYYTFTWSSSGSTLYQNGIVIGTNGTGPNTTNIADDFVIGRIGTGNNNYFSGSMDDFRVYNRALSAQEVYQLYKTGK